jgi:hypothetical protein
MGLCTPSMVILVPPAGCALALPPQRPLWTPELEQALLPEPQATTLFPEPTLLMLLAAWLCFDWGGWVAGQGLRPAPSASPVSVQSVRIPYSFPEKSRSCRPSSFCPSSPVPKGKVMAVTDKHPMASYLALYAMPLGRRSP